MKIVVHGWRKGFQKVEMTKLQIEILRISLNNAKRNVDSILEGIVVELEITNENVATQFIDKATKLGAICTLTQ